MQAVKTVTLDAHAEWSQMAVISREDVALPTRSGTEIRKRCIVRPTQHQAILLARLGLALPRRLKAADV